MAASPSCDIIFFSILIIVSPRKICQLLKAETAARVVRLAQVANKKFRKHGSLDSHVFDFGMNAITI